MAPAVDGEEKTTLRVKRPLPLRRQWHLFDQLSMLISVSRICLRVLSALPTPCQEATNRAGQHGELSIDLLCLRVNAQLHVA